MMDKNFSRRDFLQLSTFGILGIIPSRVERYLKPDADTFLLRITADKVHVRDEPNLKADILYTCNRDELVHAYYPVDTGIGRNSIWYRTWGGFIFSGFTQQVNFHLNDPVDKIPDNGCLVEVSIPYTRSMLKNTRGGWQPNYRLYYGSTHWVEDMVEGPDGSPWYQIADWYRRKYYAPVAHLRMIREEELSPIHSEIPRNNKWIEISIRNQELIAYEEGQIILKTKMSSGLPLNRPLAEGELSSETPIGDHFITVKSASRHMGDRTLTDTLDSGALPGVPWVCFFDKDGYSLHGTYWHNNFGNRMSHGCVNLRNEDAKWLYRWVEPHTQVYDWEVTGWGTRVSVRE